MIYLDNNTFQQEIFIPRSSVKNDASPEYATKNELENAIENEVIRADEKYAAKTDLLPYATTGWVESQDFATKEWTDEQIQSAITSETERTEETYQKKSEMGIYSTTEEVENMIDGAVSGKMDTSAMSAYTKTEGFATINGSAITSGGNIVVEATPYTAGTNIDITDHIISVTGITLPTKVSELVNDEGYITTADTQNFVTSGDVQTQINDSISGKADSSAVTAQISEVKAQIEAEIPSKVSDLQNDLNFASTGDVKTQVESYNYINSGQAQTQIDNSIIGKVDTDIFTAYTANTQTELNNKQDISGMTAYYTSAQTDTAIQNATNGLASEEWVESQGYLKEHQSLSAYSTTEQMNQAIGSATAATTGWVESQGYLTEHQSLSAYTKTEDFATINGSAITSGGNIVVEETPYSGGTNIDITDHIISVTGITVPTKLSELTNDSGYINSEQAQTQIDNSISGKVNTDIFTAYTANTKTEIDNAVSVKADSSRVDEIEEVTASALVELHSTKQDILVSGTNIKTINNQSLLGSGNIEIQGGSGSDYSAGANIDITNNVISVTGITIPTSNTAFTNDAGYVNSGEVETQITSKGYITGYTESDPVFQASAASGISEQDISNWNAKLDSSALNPYYTSAQTDTAISNATSGKQDTLVSGTNIKTINNQSLLGSGNIEIQGGSGGSSYTAGNNIDITNDVISVTGLATINGSAITEGGNIVIQGGSGGGSNIIELTQAEYDALTAYTEDVIYVITDSQAINMDNYVTTGDLGSYYTSAQTDTAISNAVSGKTDKVSVTASSGGYKFPTWNNQGCITGTYSSAYQASQSINGSSRTLYSTSSSSLPTIYAPTSAGSAGQPLLSNGSGAPVWGAYKFQFISQSQYDALATKDSTTIYFIVNEN